MSLPYQSQFCTFDSLPQMVSVNSSGTAISNGDKRQDVRDGIRKSTCFKVSDAPQNVRSKCSNFSALNAIDNGDCCHPVVKNALESLKRIVDLGGTGSGISSSNLNEMMNRCVNSWNTYGNFSNSEKERVGRYCRQMASQYYNELRGKYTTCKANFNPANFNETNTNEICGCMDDVAVNYDPSATNSNGICGICEYADDRPETAWGTDSQGNEVVYVGSGNDDKPPMGGTSPVGGGGSNSYGPICWSPCPNTTSVQSATSYCPPSYPYYSKPTCDRPSSNLSLDSITDRIAELTDILANRPAPTTATSNAEIEALRSEMSMLQNLYMQGQQSMPYGEEPKTSGMGNIPAWAIVGAVAVIGLVVVLNKRKGAGVSMPAPSPMPVA